MKRLFRGIIESFVEGCHSEIMSEARHFEAASGVILGVTFTHADQVYAQ